MSPKNLGISLIQLILTETGKELQKQLKFFSGGMVASIVRENTQKF